jgi:hypothetical protein
MEQTGGHERGAFEDGLAPIYKDGLRVLSEAAPAGEVVSTAHNVPPKGLTGDALRQFRDLTNQERRVSAQRRRLHNRIAFVRSQGVSGNEQTESQLAYLVEQERFLSRRRKELHRLIDEIR